MPSMVDLELVSSKDLLIKTFSSQLTPFVTKNMELLKGDFEGDPKGGLSGERYLEKWKNENGMD